MNIIMIGPDRSVHGGISGVVNNLCEAGLESRINLQYIGTMSEGGKIHKLLVAAKAYLKFVKSVKKADVVHIHMASDSSFYRKALFVKLANKKGKKIVIHQHGGDFINYYHKDMDDRQKKYARTIFDMSDKLILLTPEYREFFAKILPERVDDIVVLPNSVKVPSESVLNENLINKQPHSMLFLGRICDTKGVGELLEAVGILKEEYPDIELNIGGIYEEEKYRPLIESMAPNVKCIGWISGKEKEKYLFSSGLFVLPTYFEGQPVSVLEAMAYHLSVVASNVGGIPMMIRDGENGVLTEPKNVDSLVKGIKRVLDNPEEAKKLAKKAYEDVLRDYSIDASLDKLIKIYESLIN